MNRLSKISPAATPLAAPAVSCGSDLPQVDRGLVPSGQCVPSFEARRDTPFAGDPPNFIELGYGTGPRCIQCRKNVSACLCNAEEPDVMPVEDMKRIMPEFFADEDDAALIYVDRISPTRIAL